MMPKPVMVGQEATFCIENKSFIVGSLFLRINKSVSISRELYLFYWPLQKH